MTTSGNSEVLIDEYLSKKVLHRAEPELQVHKLGRMENIPGKNSKTARWVRYGSVAANTTPLTEKTTPSETAISTSDVEVIAAQYGQWACVSDELEDVSSFNNLDQAADILADSARKTIESLVIAEIDSAAAQSYANGVANANAITASDILDLEDLIGAANDQASDNLPPHSQDMYAVVLHRANLFDLMVDTTGVAFTEIMKHTNEGQKKLMKGELGSLYNLRFFVSDLMSSADNTQTPAVNVKSNYVFAYEPFGTVDIKSRGIRVMRTKREPSDSDPLSQRQKVGYKFWYAVKYLQASSKRAIRVRAASARG